MTANCCIGFPEAFERKVTFRRTQSAHSRAIARCVSLLRSRISNSEPARLDSACSPGMKNLRRSLRSLSVTPAVTNDGEVKMNSSSLTCSSSLRSASNAKMENVDAAMRTFEPGLISVLRSSPRRSLTLSMMRMRLSGLLVVSQGRGPSASSPFVESAGLELQKASALVSGRVLLNPGVNAVLGELDVDVGGDEVDFEQQRLSHIGSLSTIGPVKLTCTILPE